MNKSESKYFNTALLMDEALLLLLEKKEFEYISVKEICQKAGVNRSTFYLHYENTNELLVEAIEMINKRFSNTFNMKSNNIKNSSKEDMIFIKPEFIIPYLNFVKENKRVFKLIHDKPEVFGNKNEFEKLYATLFSPILDKYNLPEHEKKYIFAFYTQGVLAIILAWVSNDCKDTIEYISELIMRLFKKV